MPRRAYGGRPTCESCASIDARVELSRNSCGPTKRFHGLGIVGASPAAVCLSAQKLTQ